MKLNNINNDYSDFNDEYDNELFNAYEEEDNAVELKYRSIEVNNNIHHHHFTSYNSNTVDVSYSGKIKHIFILFLKMKKKKDEKNIYYSLITLLNIIWN